MLGLNMKILIGAISIIVSFAFGYDLGYKKYIHFKDEVQVVAEVQKEQTKEKEVKSNEVTQSVVTNYKSSVARLQHNASSGQLSTIPNTSSGTNESAAYAKLTEECTVTTLQLTALQEWVKEQYLVNK